ncbi:MAG TPA: hypothetical protein VGZ51_07725 [Actinomycetota bacterium]|nr:hypothetical protein [Actinomycetota bacterium]
MTTDETVDCHNCGRSNPEWAQVCRSCGVQLRHGQTRVVATGRFPTDATSLISIAAVIGVILGAVVLGLFISGLNPTDPIAGGQPTPSPTPTASLAPTETPIPTVAATPGPTPVPLPGRLAFGESLDGEGKVAEEVQTFTPSMVFAYSVEMPGGFGASQIENEVVRVDDARTVVLAREAIGVSPDETVFGYVVGSAAGFIDAWGPGQYTWRVFIDDELVARKRFRLAEG